MSTEKIKISLDMGYASIGWAVASVSNDLPRVPHFLGTGSVIFEPDRCLASARRAFRRQRRHIRATRTRIQRLKSYLVESGVITSQIASKRHLNFEPWRLAAMVLQGKRVLTAEELWTVLLWYAHNRGYDGNRLWSSRSRGEEDVEDAKKVEAAKAQMEVSGKTSMAETILDVVTDGHPDGPAIKSYKALSVAFPRETVVREVTAILEAHIGKISGLTDDLVATIIADPLESPDVLHGQGDVPKAYLGGYLFGQTKPRFDNRMPTICPITGMKTPSAMTDAFLEFRWASLLSHVRVGEDFTSLRGLQADEIAQLNAYVKTYGRFTPKVFKEMVREITQAKKDNLNALFNVPDQETNLIRYPGLAQLDKTFGIDNFKDDEESQKRLRVLSHVLFKGKAVASEDILPLLNDNVDTTKFLNKHYMVTATDGRAPYAATILKQASAAIFEGKDPWTKGGVLYRDATKEDPLPEDKIDTATNNHLVRHRVKIMLRLLNDIVKNYAENNPARVETIFLEVARDIKDFSGKKQKVIQTELNAIFQSHNKAVEHLAKELSVAPEAISAGLARKERIAKDLDYTCPYTGKRFDPIDIRDKMVDLDHILPHSQRQSNSLDSLVLTYNAVNKLKGARTGLQFIRECGGTKVKIGKNEEVQIRYEKDYLKFVDSIKIVAKTRQEKRVAKKRIQKLKLLHVSELDEMPEGMLTQTSSIMKLATRAIRGWFAMRKCKQPQITMIPGFVTKEVRSKYALLGMLAKYDIRLLETFKDLDGKMVTRAVPKGKMRNLTHMHHAVDAIAILLSGLLITPENHVWSLMRKRHHTEDEEIFLRAHGPFAWTKEGRLTLQTLPPETASTMRKSLGELRTTRYTSKRIGRTVLEQTQWSVDKIKDGRVFIHQRVNGKIKTDELAESATYGLFPKDGQGKLKTANAIYVSNANYGVALMQSPRIIRERFVWQQLQMLAQENEGKMPIVLRKGDLVRIDKVVWVVRSIKDKKTGICLSVSYPYNAEGDRDGVSYYKGAVGLQSLIKRNAIQVLHNDLTGVPACPITSLKSPATKKQKSSVKTNNASVK